MSAQLLLLFLFRTINDLRSSLICHIPILLSVDLLCLCLPVSRYAYTISIILFLSFLFPFALILRDVA